MVRRSRRRKRPVKGRHDNQGSVLWAILLLGLVFCVVDFGYMFYATHSQVLVNTPVVRGSLAETTQQQIHDAQVEFTPDEQIISNQIDNGDKERVIQVLRDAKMAHSLTAAQIDQLPTWQQVVDRLGPAPRIHGLDSCQDFQTTIVPEEAFIAPAGAFNSGTNLMAELLIANCYNPARYKKYGTDGVRWQVNWGKHQPPKFRLQHGVYRDKKAIDMPNENILPVVTIRDPYTWLQSMCRNRYAAHWFHEANFHCPNLIPNEVEREFLPQALDGSYKRERFDLHHKDPWLMDNVMNTANYTLQSKTVPVYVKYNRETMNHDSLADMWNDWYRDYYNATFPRVMVRYEDLLFYGKEVTTAACECFGGKMRQPFKHVGDSAKKGDIHVNKTSLLDNLIKFGHKKETDLIKGMTPDDLEFAHRVLAADMMATFSYHHPHLLEAVPVLTRHT